MEGRILAVQPHLRIARDPIEALLQRPGQQAGVNGELSGPVGLEDPGHVVEKYIAGCIRQGLPLTAGVLLKGHVLPVAQLKI